jgi:hypothetical protein
MVRIYRAEALPRISILEPVKPIGQTSARLSSSSTIFAGTAWRAGRSTRKSSRIHCLPALLAVRHLWRELPLEATRPARQTHPSRHHAVERPRSGAGRQSIDCAGQRARLGTPAGDRLCLGSPRPSLGAGAAQRSGARLSKTPPAAGQDASAQAVVSHARPAAGAHRTSSTRFI